MTLPKKGKTIVHGSFNGRERKEDHLVRARREEIARRLRANEFVGVNTQVCVRTLNFSKLKRGDIILSTGHDPVSWAVREALGSEYSHVSVYMGEIGGHHVIKDFRKFRAGRTRPISELRRQRRNLMVLRLKTTPEQLTAFAENISRIRGNYDKKLALTYFFHYNRWARNVEKRFLRHVVVAQDVAKYTCSEMIADALCPPADKIKSGELVAVNPPIILDERIDPKLTTPKTIHDAYKKGVLEFVTDEYYAFVPDSVKERLKKHIN